jgi:hypothetical protein
VRGCCHGRQHSRCARIFETAETLPSCKSPSLTVPYCAYDPIPTTNTSAAARRVFFRAPSTACSPALGTHVLAASRTRPVDASCMAAQWGEARHVRAIQLLRRQTGLQSTTSRTNVYRVTRQREPVAPTAADGSCVSAADIMEVPRRRAGIGRLANLAVNGIAPNSYSIVTIPSLEMIARFTAIA